jgi:hypothetical protein
MADQTGRTFKTIEEWTRRVLEELATSNANQEALVKEINSFKEATNKKLDTLTYMITGNGDPSKGILFRLTQVEQSQQSVDKIIQEDKDRRTWMFRTSLAACFTAIASLIVAVGKYFISN